ncbi:GNAT family N-acetyltransferase [Virgibacillus sp. SK37]|uniref:GNAT family N-acetyltransferase n=1 Tax=Virgibacillus sp. SK37 TaxID=403957 RepID=UPI0004D16F3B|nr:GNAT family N-acetyltransferase [Virgibacillus sp. SK37]AIF42794.1 hypothetical protein X953_05660 [Virgibacillus sp. SK37]
MKIKKVENQQELEQAYNVRMVVFVDEQQVSPEEEMDENDAHSIHFVGYEGAEPIAASRLRFVDTYGKLERICILKEHRGKSFGRQMIEAMEREIAAQGYQKAKLNGQIQAENFYKKLGYQTVSDVFMDAGIPHVTMVKEL